MYKYEIAFIIPAYNIGKYLGECIESVLIQTRVKKQIIIVNDGSNDNTIDVAMEYQNKYDFIEVIDKENEGVSIARNTGISKSDAEYLCFMDGDDIYVKDFAFELLDICRKNQLDIVRGQYKLFGQINYEGVFPEKIVSDNISISGKDFLINSMKQKTSEVVPWLGFFKSSFLKKNHIYFPEGISFAEDQLFFLNSLLCCESIMDTPIPFYGYRIRENSATSGGYSEKKVNDIFFIVDKEIAFSEIYPENKKEILSFASTTLSQVFSFYKRGNHEQRDLIVAKLSKYKKYPIIRNGYNWKIRMKLFVATRCPRILKLYGKMK